MSAIHKIDSNITGLRFCEELTLGVLDPTPANQTWFPLEPNSYNNFGGQIKTVARNPINASRQRKKGVVVDTDASGGFNTDLTQTNLTKLLQGFFFSNAREKHTTAPLNSASTAITAVTASTHKYTVANGDSFVVGQLILASGFTLASNNGLKTVATVNTAYVTVSETLVDETPTAAGKLTVVGWKFASAEATITSGGGNFPTLTRGSGATDYTTFGLVPGEWVFIGGDSAGLKFATAADNGFARVRSVTASVITFDKTAGTMVADVGTGKTVQIFFGRVIRNELGTNIVRRTYQLERTLGANNDADLTKVQAEYLIGALPNEWALNIPTAAKVTSDLSFVAINNSIIDENDTVSTIKSLVAGAVAPSIAEASAFNTSSDVSRINLSVFTAGTSNPTPLFAYVQDLTLTLKNNAVPNKAVGVTGAFEVTAGTFEVAGKLTAYFADVAAVNAVRNNSSVSLDVHMVKSNAGVSFDIPLLTLGDGRPDVKQDQPILLPLTGDAATAAFIDSTLDYTFLAMFWDWLPSLADS